MCALVEQTLQQGKQATEERTRAEHDKCVTQLQSDIVILIYVCVCEYLFIYGTTRSNNAGKRCLCLMAAAYCRL